MRFKIIKKNTILDEILQSKLKDLVLLKQSIPLKELQQKVKDLKREVRDFRLALINNDKVSLIAEIKKASPSFGNINTEVDIIEQAKTYEKAGASAISVLTDIHFKGEIEFIKDIRNTTTIPILRKDFIFDLYQVYESYLAGADAILLIATILDQRTLNDLVELTHELGMECLIEVHTKEDLGKALKTKAKIIGINARNLETFEVNLDTVVNLILYIPSDRLIIAESGIETYKDVHRVANAGAKGILVGTALMKAKNVDKKIQELCVNYNFIDNIPKIKICGVTTIEDGIAIANLKPEYIGFIINYTKSQRNIDPTRVKDIIKEIKKISKNIQFVGIFVDQKPDDIKKIVKMCELDVVQLYGNYSIDDVKSIKNNCEVWKSIIVHRKNDVENSKIYEGVADKVLFDAGMGSGSLIDLSLLIGLHIDALAGGLGVENINNVLNLVSPKIIDASSKLEISPGKKNIYTVDQFIKKVRQEN